MPNQVMYIFQEGEHSGLLGKISLRRKTPKSSVSDKEDVAVVSSTFSGSVSATDKGSLAVDVGEAVGGGGGTTTGGSGSTCSSPEHPTVAKRPSLTSSRGPPIQQGR